jgi:tetratricopeptide (TPR) repeat protein
MLRKNQHFDALIVDAAAHMRAGNSEEAAATYQKALEIVPGHAGALHNLGVIAARSGDHARAIEYLEAALATEPHYASAHHNLGLVLRMLGRREAAIASLRKSVALEPGDYAAHRALAFALLAEGERDRALDHFARTYELRRGEDQGEVSAQSLNQANSVKLRHDAAQFRYLAQMRRDSAFAAMARSYETVSESYTTETRELTDSDRELLGTTYNTAIHVAEAPEVPDRAVRRRADIPHYAEIYKAEHAGVVTIDDLLTPRAFKSLRRYLLESTIWHDFSHIQGFVATYLEDGLACPLLLQIIDELRELLPEVLREHPLCQAWAFKAVEPTAAIDVHSDDATISVNLWMTPSRANLDVAHGGLGVCLRRPPSDWTFSDYRADQARAVQFLRQNPDSLVVVPYGENRAALFDSRLLHYSDAPVFEQAYENYRINVTLLFA